MAPLILRSFVSTESQFKHMCAHVCCCLAASVSSPETCFGEDRKAGCHAIVTLIS